MMQNDAALYRYKIELHSHSKPTSLCSDVDHTELVRIYHGLGYDAVTVTNHFTAALVREGETTAQAVRRYFEDYESARAEGERLGIQVLFGMEIRFMQNNNDYLVYGASEEDAIRIMEMIQSGERIESFYPAFKTERNVILQAHPFRNGMERVDKAFLDGIESFNLHPNHNSRVGIAHKYARELNCLAICGTDFHHFGQEGLCGIRSKWLPKDAYALAKLLQSREYLFDISGSLMNPYE